MLEPITSGVLTQPSRNALRGTWLVVLQIVIVCLLSLAATRVLAQPAQKEDRDTTTETTPASAPTTTPSSKAAADLAPALSLEDVIALVQQQQEQLRQQQSELAQQQAELGKQRRKLEQQETLLAQQSSTLSAQRRRLESQNQKITTLTNELDTMRQPAVIAGSGTVASPVDELEQREPPATLESRPLPAQKPVKETPEAVALNDADQRAEETGDAVVQAQQDDPTRALLEDFKGAWRLPGTNAALGIGGFVKAAVVYNFDPLEITDRFIVGSIPAGISGASDIEAQSSLTANQSRINFDLREPTEFGILRAFIEGDFAEENDTLRLRHAFGQWNKVLAGKTWSAFVDTQASPEEVDFEGLNGRINVRQSQIRVMPTIGRAYEFQISMEDPNPQVENAIGVTRAPDFVFSGRFAPRPDLQTKASLLTRQIRAQRMEDQGGGVEKQYAWGLSLSGRYATPRFNDRDNLLFQMSYGNGIGRYVNDLSSVGSYDGIINPGDGELELFDIFAGYLSWQHWWDRDVWGLKWLQRNQMRSNFTLGVVDIDNPGFVSGDAYKRTIRFSTNLFWSPTPRIDIGGEWLWGSRENEDGTDGDARQIQISVRYRF